MIQEIRLSRVHINGRLPGHHGPDNLSIYFYGDAILNIRLWQQVADIIANPCKDNMIAAIHQGKETPACP